MDSSLQTPESRHKRNGDDDKTLSWDDIVGKLMLRGFTPQQIGDMTLRNVYQSIYAINDEMRFAAKLQGAEIDDDDVMDVTADTAGYLETMINNSVRGGV